MDTRWFVPAEPMTRPEVRELASTLATASNFFAAAGTGQNGPALREASSESTSLWRDVTKHALLMTSGGAA